MAIIVADGVADFGEGEGLATAGFVGEWVQKLIGALILRAVARSELVGVIGEASEKEMKGFERVMGIN